MANEDVKKVDSESPEEKFRRLASKRVNAALKKIQLLGNLSRSQYKYDSDQAQKIIDALKSAVSDVEAKFTKKGPAQKGFSL